MLLRVVLQVAEGLFYLIAGTVGLWVVFALLSRW